MTENVVSLQNDHRLASLMEEVDDVITHRAAAQGLKVAEVIGVLEILKLDILDRAYQNGDD